ncbi:oligosaccharide flippase family protein [Allohahella marinimesophila]|uniref:Lipopolysaccharide biosynthesis protein n=1 Tax=Allohahella marinimesophila TaxID=1054972 RepID=A0ABP7PXC1_9GAMM
MSIRNKLLLSYAQQYTSMFLQFISMVVIARLMLPEEVGIFATGAAIVAFGGVLVELGQLDYLVKKDVVDAQHRRTALGIALVSSWSSGLLIILGSTLFVPADQVLLGQVIVVLAISSMLAPLSMLLRANLLREMQFQTLYLINVSKDCALVFGSILFVYLGYSALGLAIGLLLEQLVLVAVALVHHQRHGWVLPSLRKAHDLLGFGILNTAMNGLSTIGQSVSRLTIGGLLGYAGLGLLNRAQKVTKISNELLLKGLLPVLLPYLSKTVREGGNLQYAYTHKLAFISGLSWPFFLYMAIAAEPIVLTLLGDQWTAAIPVIRVLCLSGIFLPFSFGAYKFLVVLDLLRAFLPLQLGIQLITIAFAMLGSLHSLEAACLAFVVASSLKGLVSLWLIRQSVELRLLTLIRPFVTSALMTLFTGLFTWLAMMPELHPIVRFIWVSGVFGLAWLAAVYLFRHPIAQEISRAFGYLQARLSA